MSLHATHRHGTRDKDSTDEQTATAGVNKKRILYFSTFFWAVGRGRVSGPGPSIQIRREVSYCCSPASTSLFDDGPHSFFFSEQDLTCSLISFFFAIPSLFSMITNCIGASAQDKVVAYNRRLSPLRRPTPPPIHTQRYRFHPWAKQLRSPASLFIQKFFLSLSHFFFLRSVIKKRGEK